MKNEIILEKDLKSIIKIGLDLLYKRDIYLIRKKVSERAVVFKFGVYFSNLISLYYPKYDVDIEYNRSGDDPKRLISTEKLIIPDLIFHKRGCRGPNILFLEFKTYWNKNQEEDENKIKEVCNPEGKYKYQYGITVLLEKNRSEVKINFYHNNNWEEWNL
ncbi:hypothetical protein [Fusobacterium gonidiaformans]|uniref:hypothetical protein n=1 Tax=Fusobacterium gonidiaformans TaxID=849 RepID=UPI0023F54232|nr:hypothetical protein [Fusobacterium gonidiaformans]